jgi:MYXO-CTERM domain-containing protein
LLDATGVTLGIALSPGLRADSASWPLGTCSVGTGRIDCEGIVFAAQSNVTVSIGVTGTSAGANTVDFSLSSTEAEADPANNSATATVNVGTLPEAESSSGGGGAALWLLPLLGTIALRRRRFPQGPLTRPR